MNYKFKKKPVEIEAFQMTKMRLKNNEDWPEWLHKAWQKDSEEQNSMFYSFGRDQLYVHTLEGNHRVTLNDYIIKGVQGELYPCKPDIFKQTYAEVL